jgi:hypothetical protein
MWKIIRWVWAKRRWSDCTIGIKITSDEHDPYQAPIGLTLLKTCVTTQCIIEKDGQPHLGLWLINGLGTCDLWLNWGCDFHKHNE